MRRLFLIFTLIISFSLFSQTDFQSENFIKKNILDRGYHDPKFIFELNDTGYYWIINRPTNRYYLNPSYRKEHPIIIAIHDVEKDENILKLKPANEPNTLQKTQQFWYDYEDLNLKLNAFLEPIALIETRGLQILHFVKDFYLENHSGISNHQIRFQKNKDDKDVEDPILKSKHPIFNGKTRNGSVVLGYHKHGVYDRNSVKDALLIRNQQTTYGVESSKGGYVKSGSIVFEKSHNPSGVILNFDDKRRGNRNRGTEILYGKDGAEKIQELNNYILKSLDSDPNIIVINWKSYIKNMFYGNFDKIKPELTNKGIAGMSGDYFPEFHNGFLYYVHQKYGDSYYPNLTYKDFKIITTRTKKDRTGSVINESSSSTPYRIFLPILFKDKFEQYLDKDQFTWSGEQFDLEMEYLILDFLNQHNPESDAFKQLLHNVYRYSKKMKPVVNKSELIKF